MVVVVFVALVMSSFFFGGRGSEDFQAGKIGARGKKREGWRFQERFYFLEGGRMIM